MDLILSLLMQAILGSVAYLTDSMHIIFVNAVCWYKYVLQIIIKWPGREGVAGRPIHPL